jgi:hypothetical protein
VIRFKHKGGFENTEKFFDKASKADHLRALSKYGQEGVNALASATPTDSGATAAAWSYEIVDKNGKVSIFWSNSNVNDGVNIAVILQYGHGTRNGGYVRGRDYINPAIRPIFEKIADEAWKEVTVS